MQRKQQVGECWVCVIFFACVCVWVHQIRQLGSQGGAGMPPPGYVQRSAQRPEFFFFGRFLLFLADFAIFS
jgi:hypothetical protein